MTVSKFALLISLSTIVCASSLPAQQCEGGASPQFINHQGVDRWCCEIVCNPGQVPKICDDGVPGTSSCVPCPEYAYNPSKIGFGQNCRLRSACELDYMFIKTPGDSTRDNKCGCNTGYKYEDIADICILDNDIDPIQIPEGPVAPNTPKRDVITQATKSSTTKPVQHPSKSPIVPKNLEGILGIIFGLCALFIAIIAVVFLWCRGILVLSCCHSNQLQYQTGETPAASEKENLLFQSPPRPQERDQILASCHQDGTFQKNCWNVAVEKITMKMAADWKGLGYQLLESQDVACIESDHHHDGCQEMARKLLITFQHKYGMSGKSGTNFEIVGDLMCALDASGKKAIAEEICKDICDKYGSDLQPVTDRDQNDAWRGGTEPHERTAPGVHVESESSNHAEITTNVIPDV